MENDAAVSADLKGIELISSVADKESVIGALQAVRYICGYRNRKP